MSRYNLGHAFALPALLAFTALPMAATPVFTVPSGLNPGDHYRLIFVTSTMRDATSTDILDYDNFVTTAANSNADLAGLGTTWQVVGSTLAISAAAHIGSFLTPIYTVADELVASGTAGLWSGNLNAAIHWDEAGVLYIGNVWTGTFADGSSAPGFLPLGEGGGVGVVLTGFSGSIDSLWVSISTDGPDNPHPFYGISGDLTVPIPEPSSFTLIAVGITLLWGMRKCR